MKYFIAIEEDLLMKLWMHHPDLVIPFSRPFLNSNDTGSTLIDSDEIVKKLELKASVSSGSEKHDR